jgi:glycosyltransferase involved in cell wall biosynthesis
MADAAESLAERGHRVIVLTSRRGYENAKIKFARRECRGGVDIVRLPLSSFGKASLIHRLIGQILFVLQVILRGVFARRLVGILVSTSPPMGSFAAVVIGCVRRVPINYWLMDLNPDQLIAMGKATHRKPLVKAMKWLNGAIFSIARNIIVLDRFMADRIMMQYKLRGRMLVLPPWPHDEVLEEVAPHDNPFVKEYNPQGRFVVMYSGNHSPASPISTLLDAAKRMQHDPRYLFMFVGGGSGKREVDEAIATHQLENTISLPYQPLEKIKFSLSAADLHVVTLGNNMPGIIHPCKLYGAMAIGRPVLLIGPRPSHASDLIDRCKIGWQIEHGDTAGVLAAIRCAREMPNACRAEMGRIGRAIIREEFSKHKLCGKLCDVVEGSVVGAQIIPHFGYTATDHMSYRRTTSTGWPAKTKTFEDCPES